MRIVVTGSAGFIGFHATKRLLDQGHEVVGIDSYTDYYHTGLKRARTAINADHPRFRPIDLDCADGPAVKALFKEVKPERVVHLAAQAGVRYSLANAPAYVHSNLDGFLAILEACRDSRVGHLVFASSSSVYGLNRQVPYREDHPTDHPVSLYAATKKANEVMAHSYSHLFGLPCTGLRFFTVYGPWGRPDMAYFSFTKAILAGQPIPVFNGGSNRRDFTEVGDITAGILMALERIPTGIPTGDGNLPSSDSTAPYRIFNLGNDHPVTTLELIAAIERACGRTAEIEMRPPAPGDVEATWADLQRSRSQLGYAPETTLDQGIPRFVDWFRSAGAERW